MEGQRVVATPGPEAAPLAKVATGSYILVMADRKTVGIKDLKNNLSAYLREVRRGTRVLVSDRNEVIAELHEPGAVYATTEGGSAILASWARAGIVTLPTRAKTPVPKSPVRLPKGTAARLFDEDRGEPGR